MLMKREGEDEIPLLWPSTLFFQKISKRPPETIKEKFSNKLQKEEEEEEEASDMYTGAGGAGGEPI